MRKKKRIFSFLILLVLAIVGYKLLFVRTNLPDIDKLYSYCKKNGYSTDYCILVDFSKPSGTNRCYIYSFTEHRITDKSLCAQGLGTNNNIFVSKFSNEPGSNYSSLGKYKVGKLRKMSNPLYGKGYTVYGLDASNSNAFSRAILIHKGNLPFETFPLPCLPVSKGCFALSSKMMKRIGEIKNHSDRPILLYAYLKVASRIPFVVYTVKTMRVRFSFFA